METKENPGALARATEAETPNHATAKGTHNVPHRKAQRHNAGTPYRVTPSEGEPFGVILKGRTRWALEELRKAGELGCTPIHNPAPRWSAYVHELRGAGVEIETITESHEGEFPGHHGRYVLRCGVSPDWKGGCA